MFAVFAAAALLLYAPALDGPFVSDDLHYVPNNPYVTALSAARLPELLHPRGEPVALVENYAPLHLLGHALAWRLFGPAVRGHHVQNVLLHALAAVLLVALLRRSGLPEAGALFGGAVFLVHPANVEAVAWISQLKSPASLALAMAALLLFERRPGWATLAFAAGLLAKPTAAFALPVAALLAWIRARPGEPSGRRTFAWLGVWAALFAAFAVAEMIAFQRATAVVEPLHPDAAVRLRTSVAFALRYLAMAFTSAGLSAFHEPPPALSPLDPWWLGGAAALALLGVRTAVGLARRREEAAWWAWAAVSYLPVSQLFPFPFPLADRYLYSILPGLIGGALLWASAGAARWPPPAALRRAGAVAALLLLAALGARSHERARLWRVPALLVADAATRYPDGVSAHLLRARRALEHGRAEAAVAALRGAHARGYDRFEQLLADPGFASLRGRPDFEALLRDMAGRWLARLERLEDPSQAELYSTAVAHRLRGELPQARRALERALARGGPLDAAVRRELRALPEGGGP